MKLSTLLAASATTVALALSGCSSEESEPHPSTESSDKAKTSDEPLAEPKELTGRECLTGSWLADNKFLLARMKEIADEMKDVTGEVVVTFGADGSMRTTYDKWHITAVTQGMPSTIERNGDDKGTFTASDTSINLKEDRVTSTLKVTAGGHSMAVPANPVVYTNAAFVCNESTLTITTPDGPMRMTRR